MTKGHMKSLPLKPFVAALKNSKILSLSLLALLPSPPPTPHTLPPPYHPSFSFLAQTLNNPLKHLEKSSRGLPWNISDCHVWHTLARENNFTHEWAKISRSVSLLFILWSSFATCFHAVKFIFSWGTGKGLVFFKNAQELICMFSVECPQLTKILNALNHKQFWLYDWGGPFWTSWGQTHPSQTYWLQQDTAENDGVKQGGGQGIQLFSSTVITLCGLWPFLHFSPNGRRSLAGGCSSSI